MPAVLEHIVDCSPEVFTQNFNRLPHEIYHSLATSPLFQLPALVELAQHVAGRENPHHPMGDVYFNRGAVDTGAKAELGNRSNADVTQLLREIEDGQTWIILKHIEREPGYREVLETCICDIFDLTGKEILKDIKWFEAILFITSPNRITEYHIDRECSWIFQIRGDKDIHLFDRADKEIVPEEELESYWAVNNRAAVYKPQYESRAMVYHMQPGTGVHIPVNTPHWLKNGKDVSVTLNINFQFHDHIRANLYKANYYLRRAGLKPTAPGRNQLIDRLKSRTYTVVQGLRRQVKGAPGIPDEARQHYQRIVEILSTR
jgi:hypothetical protein